MGLYDTVRFRCPSCGAYVEVQSKAGECDMRDYGALRVPADIAMDIEGKLAACSGRYGDDKKGCGQTWKVKAKQPIRKIEMELVDPSSLDEDEDESEET